MNNYFLIHGSYGNPYKNWLPWLKSELSVRKKVCIVPHFPSSYWQNYSCWSCLLKAYLDIGCITEQSTFVTHSLGGIFLAKFLLENKIKVKKIVFIAAFNNLIFEKDKHLYTSFYLEKEKLSELNEYCNNITCIYSDNDLYIPESVAVDFANTVGARKVCIPNAEHFTGKSGYREFKELLNYLEVKYENN